MKRERERKSLGEKQEIGSEEMAAGGGVGGSRVEGMGGEGEVSEGWNWSWKYRE